MFKNIINGPFCGLAIVALCAAIVPARADNVTCPTPGYYLSATGQCVQCAREYYCPGDNIQHSCPSADYFTPEYPCGDDCKFVIRIQSGDGNPNIEGCYVNLEYYYTAGYCYQQADRWNSETESYIKPGYIMCITANPGYYLAKYTFSSYGYDRYSELRACTNKPANSHYTGPGTPDEPKSGGKTDYNDCPWECDSGYGRHGDVCTTLCTAGFTQLKTSSGVTVNVYADKPSTPALNISTSRGTCYVTLAAGAANSAINVNYNGTTYHTTD